MRCLAISFVFIGLMTSVGWSQVIGAGGTDTGTGATGTGTGITGTGTAGGGGGSAFGGGGNIAGGGDAGGTSDNLTAEFGQFNAPQSAGFIGQNANAQQGSFVGGNQAIQQQAGNGGGQFGNTGGAAGRGQGQGGTGRQPTRSRTTRVIRTKITVAFDYPNVTAPQLRDNLESRFQAIDRVQQRSRVGLGSSRVFRNSQISVVPSGRTVTLQGTVASEREKDLAARIAKLEPGVDRVQNDLVVSP